MPTRKPVATRIQLLISGVCIALSLSSCVAPNPPLYRWGQYEDIIYTGYRDPGSSNPVADAELLAEDMARTEAQGQQIPPGVRIHLGYLYFAQGRNDEARALFEMERELFPESAVFVDGLLARLEAKR